MARMSMQIVQKLAGIDDRSKLSRLQKPGNSWLTGHLGSSLVNHAGEISTKYSSGFCTVIRSVGGLKPGTDR